MEEEQVFQLEKVEKKDKDIKDGVHIQSLQKRRIEMLRRAIAEKVKYLTMIFLTLFLILLVYRKLYSTNFFLISKILNMSSS